MENPITPPELPRAEAGGNKNLWIIVSVVALVGFLLLGAIVAVGAYAFRRAQEKRSAITAVTETANEERVRMAESLEKGDFTGGDSAIGRVKEQMEKSSAQLTGKDAATARAMASFLGKMQAQARSYEEAVKRLTDQNVFAFQIPDKETLAAYRQTLENFATINAQLTELITNMEGQLRDELRAANVPSSTIEETVRGYQRSQGSTRPLQMQIRKHDKVLGESGLAILDLLEKHWGRWERNAQTGQLTFREDSTLNAYNDLVEKVQTASAEQAAAQKQLADVLRARAAQK